MTDPKKYISKENSLKGKVILVTGAGTGIGQAAAIAFAEKGASIILLGSKLEHLETTYSAFKDKSLDLPLLHVLDFESATENDFQSINSVLLEGYGKLDGLLNNASILGSKKPIEYYSFEQWEKVFKVNLHSSFLLTKSLFPALKESKQGSIVFTSSGVGKVGRAYWGAYSVSKFATEGLMQVLADEVENTVKIRVNSIDPGKVRTKMREEAYPAEDPLSLPEPHEIMNAYLYLMSEESKEVNGQSINAQ